MSIHKPAITKSNFWKIGTISLLRARIQSIGNSHLSPGCHQWLNPPASRCRACPMPHAFSHLPSTSSSQLIRLNGEGISLVRPHHFTEQNHQKAGLAQPMMALARVNGADYLSIGTKHKASEGGREEVWWKKRRNLHRCRLCSMSFSTGNALGGHMSFHAKQKKLKAKSISRLSKQPLESDVAFACTFASVLQDSVNLSLEAVGW